MKWGIDFYQVCKSRMGYSTFSIERGGLSIGTIIFNSKHFILHTLLTFTKGSQEPKSILNSGLDNFQCLCNSSITSTKLHTPAITTAIKLT